MKITKEALKKIIKESLGGNKIIKERPWSVEYTFKLKGDGAEDSEGKSADGFAITMTSDSGSVMRIIVDSYWNPQVGDESGNSLKIEIDGYDSASTYVPTRFDDGKEQKLIVSNSPVPGLITVAHSSKQNSPPVVYLVTQNPFEEEEDVKFSVENIGNGDAEVEMTGFINL
jgi:hypothetical protein